MGKRKETGTEEEPVLESPGSAHKRHKKHKKKHKKKSHHDTEEFSVIPEEGILGTPKIKLKLKIGGETLGTKDVMPVESKAESSDESQIIDVTGETWSTVVGKETETEPAFMTKKKSEDTSDEEKEWLDALERGDLDDSGMLKRRKDPKLMTARQRALHHGPQGEELLQLPSGYKTVELTEEQELKRQQRAKKRRQQAQEKREKDKKLTLDRLLKKQESKTKGPKTRSSRKSNVPRVRYVNNQVGVRISVPVGFLFPYQSQKAQPPPVREKCGVKGCNSFKKYSCSKTQVPLCSLECYKKNLSLHKDGKLISPS